MAKDHGSNFFWSSRGVDHSDARRFAQGKVEIASANRFKKRLAFRLDPVGNLPAMSEPGARDIPVKIEQERDIGKAVGDGKCVDVSGGLGRNLAGDALIDSRRIEEAVADDRVPGGQSWEDHLSDKLGAAGSKEKELRFRHQPGALRGMLQQISDCLAGIGSTGLTEKERIPAFADQLLRQQADLRGFSSAFRPLERDK